MASSPYVTISEKMSRGTCRSDRVRSLVLEAGAKLFSRRGFAPRVDASHGMGNPRRKRRSVARRGRPHGRPRGTRSRRAGHRTGSWGYRPRSLSDPDRRAHAWLDSLPNPLRVPARAYRRLGRAREGVSRPLFPASLVRRASARGNDACGISRKHGRILSVEE